MSSKQKSKRRVAPHVVNHTGFKNLRQRWLLTNSFNDWAFFQTKHFSPQDFVKPLELASLMNLSITDACQLYRFNGQVCPSPELLLKCCRDINPTRMELYINWSLQDYFRNLPPKIKRYFRRHGILIIDFHVDPYYGQFTNPYVVKGQVKHSTSWGYRYLTADLCSPRGNQTLAVRFRMPGESISALFGDLLAMVEALVHPKLILMDGEFATVEILRSLQQRGIPFIARKSITKRVKSLALAYELTDSWEALRQFHGITLIKDDKKTQVFVHVTFQKVKGRMRALITTPILCGTPLQAEQWYKRRFAIESGYRDKHLFQARTTSKHLSVRLILFYLAIILWNLWQAFLVLAFPRKKEQISSLGWWRRRARIIKLLLCLEKLL